MTVKLLLLGKDVKRCEKDDFGQAEEIKKEHVVSNSSAVM